MQSQIFVSIQPLKPNASWVLLNPNSGRMTVKIATTIAGAALITLGTLAVTAAQAATLTYNFVDSNTNTTGSFTINNQIADPNSDPFVGIYEGAISSFTLTSGAFSRTVTQFIENKITLNVANNISTGFADLTGAGNTFGIPGGKFSFSINLFSDILPLTDRLVDFDPTSPLFFRKTVRSQVFLADGSVAVDQLREIDKITAVPEPESPFALALIGVLCAFLVKRKIAWQRA